MNSSQKDQQRALEFSEFPFHSSSFRPWATPNQKLLKLPVSLCYSVGRGIHFLQHYTSLLQNSRPNAILKLKRKFTLPDTGSHNESLLSASYADLYVGVVVMMAAFACLTLCWRLSV